MRFETETPVHAIATEPIERAQAASEARNGAQARAIGSRAQSRAIGIHLADGRVLRAERTVIAAGGWAEALGRAAGSRVRLRRSPGSDCGASG